MIVEFCDTGACGMDFFLMRTQAAQNAGRLVRKQIENKYGPMQEHLKPADSSYCSAELLPPNERLFAGGWRIGSGLIRMGYGCGPGTPIPIAFVFYRNEDGARKLTNDAVQQQSNF